MNFCPMSSLLTLKYFFFEKGFFRKREQPTNYLSVFDHFLGVALKG